MPTNDNLTNTLSTTSGVPPAESPHRSLTDIKNDIDRCQENYAQSYLTIGKLLIEAKAQFTKHGEWLKWVEINVDLSIRKVQRLMRVAKRFPDVTPVAYLEFTKAYILSRLSEREIADFTSNLYNYGGNHFKTVEQMSKRELEAAVRIYLKNKNRNLPPAPMPHQTETPISSETDEVHTLFERVKNEISQLADLAEDDSGIYDTYAIDLCELCASVIQQFSPVDIETD